MQSFPFGRFPLKALALVPPRRTLPSLPSLSRHQPRFGVHARLQPQVAGGPGETVGDLLYVEGGLRNGLQAPCKAWKIFPSFTRTFVMLV